MEWTSASDRGCSGSYTRSCSSGWHWFFDRDTACGNEKQPRGNPPKKRNTDRQRKSPADQWAAGKQPEWSKEPNKPKRAVVLSWQKM